MLSKEQIAKIREDFPILNTTTHGKPLIYLDNSSTTQKPQQVIASEKEYYESMNANVHRGVYPLSEKATEAYTEAHRKVEKFISAHPGEVIFTKGTTESINLLSYAIPSIIPKGKCEIVVSVMEHHSNLVPWQQLAKRNNMILHFIPIKEDFTLDYAAAYELISEKTALVAIAHVSNALGTVHDIGALIEHAKKVGAYTLIDAAQSVPHQTIDVKKLDCDFLAFSSHKLCGPTGVGVLYGKRGLLEKMDPFLFGGDMIKCVHLDDSEWNILPEKFEAGTPNIAGAIGLGAAIDYLSSIGMDLIHQYEQELRSYCLEQLKEVQGVTIYGPTDGAAIISFTMEGIHTHDASSLLSDEGVCVRGGHHCAMPLMDELGISGTTRLSFYFYNTKEEIDLFISALKKTIEVFKNG